jgi:peptide deformylase
MYQLVEEASKVLRHPPEIFDFENPREDPKEIEKNMSEAMDKFGGLGLSANQVGLPYRMFVMRTQDGTQAFFNPELTKVSQETELLKEGCLSFPDIYLMIKRSKVVEMKYQDADGEEHITTLDGIGSRCVQHEIDHLNGILFLQRASTLKLERALKARPKERKKRIEYERQQAFARALYEAQQEKEKNESSESTGEKAVSA